MKPWEVLSSKYLLRRWWIKVREDHVRLSDGSEMEEFHVVEYPDWTCVICLDEDHHLIMVEQYRHGVERMSLEFPAGAIDSGEEPLAAAKRELAEETGFVSDDWNFVGRVSPEPSKNTNYAYFFVARGARKEKQQDLDETEQLRVHCLPVNEVFQRADAGEIIHGPQLAALYWAERKGLLTAGSRSGKASAR